MGMSNDSYSGGASPAPHPIELAGVSRHFGRKRVLEHVTLRVPAGCTMALLGRNGSGKTTLMRILVGLLPRHGGRVAVAGIDPAKRPHAVKQRVGYVADATELHPRWRVAHVLEMVRALRKPSWDVAEERRLLDLFGLRPRERVGRLSRGDRAKLALLLALAPRPEILLLDEPASGLDPVVRREVLGSLVEAIHDEGRTVLLSSHLMEDVERLADRVAFLAGGRIVLEGESAIVRGRARRVVVDPIGPDLGALPGQPLLRRRGKTAVLTYVEGGEDAAATLRASGRFDRVEAERMNLEDLFVDMLGEETREVAPCCA
ncbi:MAG: ABC transporter ATP-binding protein [Planctomycetes bacterium]|nr:ABC transporter ATP-binding protein [Planctomycetota bacterium]